MRTCKYEPRNDNYWGSSKSLTEDISKLGINQFKKRILKIWNTRSNASKHERALLKKYGVEATFYNIRGYLSDAKQAEIAVEKEQLIKLKLEKKQLIKLKLEKKQLIKDIKKLDNTSRGRKSEGQKSREICKCGRRPVAINYKKNGITHYRSICSTCANERDKQKKNSFPNYIKKDVCEKCGFSPIFSEQLDIFSIITPRMIKTVCLNCKEELSHTNVWKQGDLIADF